MYKFIKSNNISASWFKQVVSETGSHYFDKDTVKAFGSKILSIFSNENRNLVLFTEYQRRSEGLECKLIKLAFFHDGKLKIDSIATYGKYNKSSFFFDDDKKNIRDFINNFNDEQQIIINNLTNIETVYKNESTFIKLISNKSAFVVDFENLKIIQGVYRESSKRRAKTD